MRKVNEEKVMTLHDSRRKKIKEEENKNRRKKLIIVILVIIPCIILIAILLFLGINKYSKRTYMNVYLEKQNMSNLTLEELDKKILDIYDEKNLDQVIEIRQGENIIDSVIAEDIGFCVDISKTKEEIYNFGRKKDVIENNLEILNALFNKKILKYSYTYDEKKLDDLLKILAEEITGKEIDDKYELDENNKKIIITKGKDGVKLDKENLKGKIIKALTSQKEKYIEIKEEKSIHKELDVDEMYKKIKREPQNAYSKTNEDGTVSFIREIEGFDIDLEKFKEEINKQENKEEGKIIDYNLNVIEPSIKYSDIAWEAYNDTIGEKTTYFPADAYNRGKNIEISAGNINNKVLMPGEIFSFNTEVGPVNANTGYKNAGVFRNGTVVDGIGGGVCQTVSTLYNAVLYANLEIVERHAHGLPVGYIEPSLDATMYQYTLDFRFKNNRKYPIKVVTTYSSNGSLNIKIMGTKQADDYDIELISKVLSVKKYGTTYLNSSKIKKGTRVVNTEGANGLVSEGYKVYKKNGITEKTELLSKDTYKPKNQVILIGTKN